jgi:predicted phage terminase large subunit-like protein
MAKKKGWKPNPGPQERFVACGAFEALYGGAAGGGKSEALLMAAVKYITEPSYRALLLRRSYPELKRSLIDRSHEVYGRMGAHYSVTDKTWTFPGRGNRKQGGKVEFGQIEADRDVMKYASAEYQFIGFDELTTFTEYMYTFLISRLRSTTGIPLYLRGGTNPGGSGHEWVLRRFSPWLYPAEDERYRGPRAEPEERLYYRFDERMSHEVMCSRNHPEARSRTFFPALVKDNPYLHGSAYEKNLDGLDRLTRQRLKFGNWMARPTGGMFFKRLWFPVVAAAPAAVVVRVRYWDRAASKKKGDDFTSGVLLSLTAEGIWTVENVVRFQGRPYEVERVIKETSVADLENDPATLLFLEEEPGASGKFETEYYARQKEMVVAGVRFIRPQGDKIIRANPFSAQAEVGNVRLVRGAWNNAYLEELEDFPEGHDDQVDATSGAMRQALFFGAVKDGPKADVHVIDADDDSSDHCLITDEPSDLDDELDQVATSENSSSELSPQRQAEVDRTRDYWKNGWG